MLNFIISDGHEITWHVNVSSDTRNPSLLIWTPEKKPEIWQYKDAGGSVAPQKANGKMREVVGIYADGHELEYILRIFNGLPAMSTNHPRYGRGVTWRGDTARFIYDNLP
jgi:hypothetical protein